MIGVYVHNCSNSGRDYVVVISEGGNTSFHDLPEMVEANIGSARLSSLQMPVGAALLDDEMHRIAYEIDAQYAILLTSSHMTDDPQFVTLYSQVMKSMCRITSKFAGLMTGRVELAGLNPAFTGRYTQEIAGIAAMAPVFRLARKEQSDTIEDVPASVWRAFSVCQQHAFEIVKITETPNVALYG